MNDWQTWTAPAVVIATVAILVWKNVRSDKETTCDKKCGCEKE
tara:strand:- start:1087 stop:1215 length:129 start_codon:yes stop_codon:yes gene_type:complete